MTTGVPIFSHWYGGRRPCVRACVRVRERSGPWPHEVGSPPAPGGPGPNQTGSTPAHRNISGPDLLGPLGPVSWRPTTVKWRQSPQSNRHSTIGSRQTEYHEALPSSANDEVRCDCTFADDGNASWYSVFRVPMVELRLDCEDCSLLTSSASMIPAPGFESRFRLDLFPGRITHTDFKTGSPQWLPCQAPGVIGSALGLVGPVSVYCGWLT